MDREKQSKTENTFIKFLIRFTAPATALVYLFVIVTQLYDLIFRLGIQILVVLIFLLLLLWSIYAWVTKEESSFQKGIKSFRYGKIVRYGAIIATLISIYPIVLVIDSYLPVKLKIEITNNSDKEIVLKYLVNYKINTFAPNNFDYTIANGMGYLESNVGDEKLIVPTKSKRRYFVNFYNQSKIKYYLSIAEDFIIVDIKVNDSIEVSSDYMLLFNKNTLDNNQLTFTIK